MHTKMLKISLSFLLVYLTWPCHSLPADLSPRVPSFQGQGPGDWHPGVYLSINSLAFTLDTALWEKTCTGDIIRRRLELNWGKSPGAGDTILLIQGNQTILELDPNEHPDGFYVTDIVLPYPEYPAEIGFQKLCVFGYEMVWKDASNTELATGCLLTEPGWMEENLGSFRSMALGDMMLPGSHDSGAYKEYSGKGDDNWATSAVFAQEEDLLHQMMWGVRFLDISIGFYPTTEEKFWLVHGIIKTHPIMEGIEDVKTFLRNTREVVIWENIEFEQVWSNEVHKEWAEKLVMEFGDWLVQPGSKGWDTTLEEALASPGPEGQGRIILTYSTNFSGGEEILQNYFRQVRREETYIDEPDDLKVYLDGKVSQAMASPEEFRPWKPNCQLTPTGIDIIGPRWSGLREMADAVNRKVTKWWREEWRNLPATFPVHDFVLGTGMVHEAIRRNLDLANQ